MKLGRTLGIVLGASLLPFAAYADDPADPYAADPVVVQPAPQQPQQPVVVVNPDPQPARTTVIARDPETYEVRDAWNAPMFATGALVFAGAYGASAVVAATSDNPAAERLYVPVVGPWLALNDWSDCPIEEPRCDRTTTDKVLLVADGVFQAAGVITMVSALLTPTTRTVVGNPRTVDKSKIKLSPTARGFALSGTF
jgi:hypothetical protein